MDTDATPGGSGGDPLEPTARDTRAVERAIRQRWPIPEDIRQRLPEELSKVIRSGRASHRNKIAAARALVMADAQNMEQERRDGGQPDQTVKHTGSVDVNHQIGLKGLTDDQLAAIITATGGRGAAGSANGAAHP